jgi:hypothetical protein
MDTPTCPATIEKLKLDENIPAAIKGELAAIGHDVRTVVNEGLVGSPDEGIWTRCQQEERLLVTQDLEFEAPLEPRIRRFEQTTLASDFLSYPSSFLSRHESTHPVCERLSFRCTQCA